MIDLEETKILLTAYSHYFSQLVSCGFHSEGNEIPDYRWKRNCKPEVCNLHCKNSQIRKECVNFYSQLKLGIGEKTCPLGVKIKYHRVETSFGFFTILVQKEFKSKTAINYLSKFPRKTKKDLTLNVNSKDEIVCYVTNELDDEIVDNFQKVVDTILAGRLSESMRAFTHELLTPIQGVMNDVKILKRQVEGNNEANATIEYLEKNIGQILHLSKNISILLNPQLKITEQSVRRVTIHSEINRIWDRYNSTIEDKKLELSHKKNKGGLHIEGVPDQIALLLNILLENAIKYSFEGFQDKPNKIRIYYKDMKQYLELSIESLGCFIEPSEYKRIFELGYRGINSNERFRNGTGSGLYIAKNIVSAHLGDIRATSNHVETREDVPLGKNIFILKLPYLFKNGAT